jgi:hypothetical protein
MRYQPEGHFLFQDWMLHLILFTFLIGSDYFFSSIL